MNRTWILLGAFVLLGVGTFAALSGEEKETISTVAGADRLFAVEDGELIKKVFIADREGNKTNLVRQEDGWIYNGTHPANPNAVRNLLDALVRIQMKFKPANAAVPGIVRSLATEGLKVEVYGRADRLLKAYYIGGSTIDERGTYAIMEGAEQPYITEIPGWQGNLRFRYSLRGEDWRDKTIFATSPSAVESISILYPKQRNKSFRLSREANGYEVQPYFDATPRFEKPPGRGNVERFLDGFHRIGAEAFENDNPKRDSVRQTLPFCTITVIARGQEEKKVSLFPIYTQYSANSGEIVERFFADINDGQDFMLVQNRLFKKILWGYDFFFQ